MNQHKQERPLSKEQHDAVEETIRLYHAWLAVLLGKLNAQEVRVGVREIKDALGQFKCSVAKEGDSYVICMEEDTHAKA